MDRQYDQLSLEDRCTIATLRAEGRSIRQIAAALDRSPSTVSRELKRNSGRQVGYKPAYAQAQTRGRRWKGARLERDAGYRAQQGLQLAPLSTARQEQTGLPGPQGWLVRAPYRSPSADRVAPARRRRPFDPRALGSRPDDVLPLRARHPHLA